MVSILVKCSPWFASHSPWHFKINSESFSEYLPCTPINDVTWVSTCSSNYNGYVIPWCFTISLNINNPDLLSSLSIITSLHYSSKPQPSNSNPPLNNQPLCAGFFHWSPHRHKMAFFTPTFLGLTFLFVAFSLIASVILAAVIPVVHKWN